MTLYEAYIGTACDCSKHSFGNVESFDYDKAGCKQAVTMAV